MTSVSLSTTTQPTPTRRSGPYYGSTNASTDERLGELLIHLADACKSDSVFGVTKLRLLLWFVESSFFARFGSPLTGVEYRRDEDGLLPRAFYRVLRQLQDDGSAVLERSESRSRYARKRLVPLRPSRLNLKLEQSEFIGAEVEQFRDLTAAHIAGFSRGRVWDIAKPDERIPYECAFLANRAADPHDRARARALADEFGWS